MADVIIVLTLMTFLLLACMTLECIMRFGFWAAWAVFCWFLAMGFAWLLIADVTAHAFHYPSLTQAPIRSGIFRSLIFIGAIQWLFRQSRWNAHG